MASAAGEEGGAATGPVNTARPCQLVVHNKAGETVAAGVSAQSFMDFKRKCGKGTAVIVQLDCGEEVMIETCKLFKKLPRGSTYKARLLRRTTVIPAELAEEASGYQVWVET